MLILSRTYKILMSVILFALFSGCKAGFGPGLYFGSLTSQHFSSVQDSKNKNVLIVVTQKSKALSFEIVDPMSRSRMAQPWVASEFTRKGFLFSIPEILDRP